MTINKSVSLLASVLLLSSSIAFAGDESTSVNWMQAGADVKALLKVNPETFKRAAVVACIQRGWSVQKVTDNKVTGLYKDSTVEITLDGENVTASIVAGPVRKRWVDGLARDMFVAFLYLSQ